MASSKETVRRNPRRDPELTKREILDAAAEVFARDGLHGARTEDIAKLTNTSKRMIFYYFDTKEDLYKAVLQENYVRFRSHEANLDLDSTEPSEALRILVRSTISHINDNPQMSFIVASENIVMHGETAEKIENFLEINSVAIETIEKILVRGRESGVFRTDPAAPSALDLHQIISSLTLFRLEHRETFRRGFGRDMLTTPHNDELVEQTVMRLILTNPNAA